MDRNAGRPTKDESPKKEDRRPRADVVADEADTDADSAERASIESVGSAERSSSVIRREVGVPVHVLPALLL